MVFKCKECNSSIAAKKKFCNSSCAAKYNNKRREKKPLPNCKNCNKELSNRTKIYCDNKCQNEYQFKTTKIPLYLEGKLKSRPTLRKILSQERGYKCNSCSISEWNGKPLQLELNHIDGNPFNDLPDNLELICPNCHSQTDSFKGRNKGKGRKLGK